MSGKANIWQALEQGLFGSGIVAAGATSVTVTNTAMTVDSLVFAQVMQADATAIVKNSVAAAGSVTINLDVAATAATKVGFLIINQS